VSSPGEKRVSRGTSLERKRGSRNSDHRRSNSLPLLSSVIAKASSSTYLPISSSDSVPLNDEEEEDNGDDLLKEALHVAGLPYPGLDSDYTVCDYNVCRGAPC
jgi:hypothetical protein